MHPTPHAAATRRRRLPPVSRVRAVAALLLAAALGTPLGMPPGPAAADAQPIEHAKTAAPPALDHFRGLRDTGPQVSERLPWPGDDRAELTLPAPIFERMLRELRIDELTPHGRPGYTREQMRAFGRDDFALETTLQLFTDVRRVNRDVGVASDQLLDAATQRDLGGALRRAWALVDTRAARGAAAPARSGWSTPLLDEELTPAEALPALLAALAERTGVGPSSLPRDAATTFSVYPEAVQRLIVRTLVATADATPFADAATPDWALAAAAREHLERQLGDTVAIPRFEDAYGSAIAPFKPLAANAAPAPMPAAFRLLDTFDAAAMAYASITYTTDVAAAVDEFARWAIAVGWTDADAARLPGLRFDTPLGPVRILSGDDDILAIAVPAGVGGGDDPGANAEAAARRGVLAEPEGAALIIDLGGNDEYRGRIATSSTTGLVSGGSQRRLGVVTLIDLGGNDVYDARGTEASIACGLFGVAGLFDLEGDDVYRGGESSIARALHGAAVLCDYSGDDIYNADGFFSHACAHAGVALLVDRLGDDDYTGDAYTQAVGGTLGAGVIIDLAGNDDYTARPDGWRQRSYRDLSVSMAQGVGVGRRSDFGDGRSLAGGWGVLVEARGNDTYTADVWAQGAGYWWGVGALEDRAGDDEYRSAWYALGAAAHFAVGSAVDLAGDDRYNPGNAALVNQTNGSARDGGVALFMDGAGDDRYLLRNRSGGSGDLGAIGLMFDRAGRDVYGISLNPEFNPETALGLAVPRPDLPRSFRDELPTIGIFLDTEGQDSYQWRNTSAGDTRRWRQDAGPLDAGIGWDVEVYVTGERRRD